MKHLLLSFLLAVAASISFAQITPSHIVIVILENNPYDSIVGNPRAPYINSLINSSHTALLTQSYGLTHPSQPNYIMFFSGNNQGIVNNNIPLNQPFTTPNLGASILNKGLTFTGYSEDLPFAGSNDSISSNGLYARKHNPWVNWQNSATNGIPASLNKPFSDFPTTYTSMPTVSIVVPNLNNDMHDGSIAMCDAWMQSNLDGYVQWCINNNSLFIVTFDEDNTQQNNHIPTFFLGANINPGSYSQPVTHYNILRTIEELYQLPYIGASADSTALQGIWVTSAPLVYTFTGNGNWSDASNWSNNVLPPATLSPNSEIKIDPVAGGQCILNIPYTVSSAGKLTVMTGKKFVVQGNLSQN